ncbi:hypothetical protein DBR42_26880, partial [Pelomonas sp. HMWF004]
QPAKVHVKHDMTPAQAPTDPGASAPTGGIKVKVSTKLDTCDLAQPETCSRAERWLTSLLNKGEAITFEQWKSRIRALAPYVMLAMQPIFAALLLLVFAGSGRRYAEHFVFSLHSHSLWFLAVLPAMALRLEGPVTLAVFIHGLLAMRRVYGLGRWGALWRGLLVSLLYFTLFVVVAMAGFAVIAMTS